MKDYSFLIANIWLKNYSFDFHCQSTIRKKLLKQKHRDNAIQKHSENDQIINWKFVQVRMINTNITIPKPEDSKTLQYNKDFHLLTHETEP